MGRTALVTIRLTPEERDYLKETAGHLSISQYVRHKVLDQQIPQTTIKELKRKQSQQIPEVNRLLYVELSRIGNNINQIARACNEARLTGLRTNVDPEVLKALSDKLSEVALAVIGVDPE